MLQPVLIAGAAEAIAIKHSQLSISSMHLTHDVYIHLS